jgi:hypothetical protein
LAGDPSTHTLPNSAIRKLLEDCIYLVKLNDSFGRHVYRHACRASEELTIFRFGDAMPEPMPIHQTAEIPIAVREIAGPHSIVRHCPDIPSRAGLAIERTIIRIVKIEPGPASRGRAPKHKDGQCRSGQSRSIISSSM